MPVATGEGQPRAERRQGSAAKRTPERMKRAAPSETWDDDFLFQQPGSSSSRGAASRSPSPGTASSSRASVGRTPTTPSRQTKPAKGSAPILLQPPVLHNHPSTLSLASIASSSWTVGSDHDATIQPTEHATPRASTERTRPDPRPSPVRPAGSTAKRPRSRLPVRSPAPAASTVSRSSSQTTESGPSSAAPSFTEDSLASLTAGEDEAPTDSDGEGTEVAIATPDVAGWSSTGKSRWSFRRREVPAKAAVRATDPAQGALALSLASRDPARASEPSAHPRSRHSSLASTVSAKSTDTDRGQRRRFSLQFIGKAARRTSREVSPSPLSPTFSLASSWREYTGTTAEDDDGDETTGPDLSELSGDEQSPSSAVRARAGLPPRSPHAHDRPTSPIESILGGDRSRWNASQVSFASTASTFGLRARAQEDITSPSNVEAATSGSRSRTIVQKSRDTPARAQPSLSALRRSPDNAGSDPPQTPTSAGASATASTSRSTARPAPLASRSSCRSNGKPAQEPRQPLDATRKPRIRSVTTPARETTPGIEPTDCHWVGVVPFPPSPGGSAVVGAPPSPTKVTDRPPSGLMRKISSNASKSRPPVSSRPMGASSGAGSGSSGGGFGSSIANFLTRSTSALPLNGKRAPSPAPSTKSAKSSRSMLFRRPSRKLRTEEPDQGPPPAVEGEGPNGWSGTVIRRRASVANGPPSPAKSSPRRSQAVPAVPPIPPAAQVPRSGSAFSFLARSRALSRAGKSSASPSSPTKPAARPPAVPAPRRPKSAGESPKLGAPAARANIDSGALPARPSSPWSSTISRRAPSRPAGATHRPSASLSSIMPLRPATPQPRADSTLSPSDFPHPGLHGPRASNASSAGSIRRNSLSDLRIPLRITAAQKKIEDDLERVKQFGKAIDDLKSLRAQIEKRRGRSPLADPCWEQAQALIDLGDGKAPRAVPTTKGPRRPPLDRTNTGSSVATAFSRSTSQRSSTFSRAGSASLRLRKASISSIDSDFSVAARQRDMLRGVLAIPNKGASLPVRAPPSPRPPLSVLIGRSSDPGHRGPEARSSPMPPPTPSSRRVSRQTLLGIRDLISRLRSRATEELAASVGSVPPGPAHVGPHHHSLPQRSFSETYTRRGPSSSSYPARRGSEDSDEDWDRDLGLAEARTGGAESGIREETSSLDGKLALTAEAMPQLLAKAAELREACERDLARFGAADEPAQ